MKLTTAALNYNWIKQFVFSEGFISHNSVIILKANSSVVAVSIWLPSYLSHTKRTVLWYELRLQMLLNLEFNIEKKEGNR